MQMLQAVRYAGRSEDREKIQHLFKRFSRVIARMADTRTVYAFDLKVWVDERPKRKKS